MLEMINRIKEEMLLRPDLYPAPSRQEITAAAILHYLNTGETHQAWMEEQVNAICERLEKIEVVLDDIRVEINSQTKILKGDE